MEEHLRDVGAGRAELPGRRGVVEFDNLSTVTTPDLAYTVEIESYRARVGGAEKMTAVAVRVTTIFRRERGMWKIVHRHAEPITAPRPPESVAQT